MFHVVDPRFRGDDDSLPEDDGFLDNDSIIRKQCFSKLTKKFLNLKILLQRVSSCSVKVDEQIIADSKNSGLLALIGFGQNDPTPDHNYKKLNEALEKIVNMRIFSNLDGRFDLSLLDTSGDLTLVPQFTLYADTSKGRRPEFFSALNPKEATILFDELVCLAKKRLGESKVHHGKFGADMKVSLTNDGPVTIGFEI